MRRVANDEATTTPNSEQVRWDARYREVEGLNKPNELISTLADDLVGQGRSLDIAGGSGADALLLAAKGWKSTLLDLSPVALDLAVQAASKQNLALSTQALDTESAALPDGPWDLIHIAHYLHRPTITGCSALLAPGGLLVVAIATTTNLERHERPPAMFLLNPGELRTLAGDLDIIRCDEDWRANGVHEAWLVASAPS